MSHINFQPTGLQVPVIQTLYTLYTNIHPKIFHFPKYERYTLGEKIEKAILDTIECISIANTHQKYLKEGHLIKAHARTEILKLLFRLAYDTECISDRE